MNAFRLCASTVSVVGFCLLGLVIHDAVTGVLAGRFFPDAESSVSLHVGVLLLALPVPLHVIFIGLIVQKRWLSPLWARFAWVGIVGSGVWLGGALMVKVFM
ncbi:MAG: hypothetical protein JEY79_15585 [Pseudodesulfovibrio sp.]|nr:hypothetical protein [Pseudodesulfovibrio sp.]